MESDSSPPEIGTGDREDSRHSTSARPAIAVILGVLLLVIGTPLALTVRIPGGMDPSWSWCLVAAVTLIPFSLWGYSVGGWGSRLLRLTACGLALLCIGTLLIQHYAFTRWEEPMRYGVHVRVP